MHQPTVTHWSAAKRLLHYLKKTIFLSIHINRQSSFDVTTFADANWAGNYDDRTSTSAYITFLGINPISWSSKKQRAVVRSLTEAEYHSLAIATSETVWLLSLFKELCLPIPSPPRLLCDNLGATHLSFNPVQHVNTHDQLANFLTKPLSSQRLHSLLLKIGLADGSSILREHIKEIPIDSANNPLPPAQDCATIIQA